MGLFSQPRPAQESSRLGDEIDRRTHQLDEIERSGGIHFEKRPSASIISQSHRRYPPLDGSENIHPPCATPPRIHIIRVDPGDHLAVVIASLVDGSRLPAARLADQPQPSP